MDHEVDQISRDFCTKKESNLGQIIWAYLHVSAYFEEAEYPFLKMTKSKRAYESTVDCPVFDESGVVEKLTIAAIDR